MKVQLLFADHEADLENEPDGFAELFADLDLQTMINTMAQGDELIAQIGRAVLSRPLTDPEEIRFRQHVLDDCFTHADFVGSLYDLTGRAIQAERSVFRGFLGERPESLLSRSVQVLEAMLSFLRELRELVSALNPPLRSAGWHAFTEAVRLELSEDYLAELAEHLKQLHFRGGLLLSATLGRSSQSVNLVLRRPRPENRTLFNRAGLKKPTFSYTVPDRDEAGASALSDLRDRSLVDIADAAAQSSDHVLGFFRTLRQNLAFYLGCLNLQAELARHSAAVSYPVIEPVGSQRLSAEGLVDACLQLRIEAPVVPNSLTADGLDLVLVTGANQGGKSTFLRSLGLAQLMASAGMFVSARSLTISARTGVYSHFKREEDADMVSGKFDEELARMSGIVDHIRAGGLLLCNESFQSTNEREASQIGRDVIDAMTAAGVQVVFVTHLFDLADGYRRDNRPALFLRAERGDAGQRPFRLAPGEPLATSFGSDVFDRLIPPLTSTGPVDERQP